MFLNRLKKDNLYTPVEIRPTAELTGLPTTSGYAKTVVSNGKVVNICSRQYALLTNDIFFGKVEQQLNATGMNWEVSSINRADSSFSADYIMTDDRFQFSLKDAGADKILPFLRFTNSYDKSQKTAGHFGYFRQVCSNGLHVATNSDIKFAIKHRGNMADVVMPKLDELIFNFVDNDMFEIKRKFEILDDMRIERPTDAIKQVLKKTETWMFEASAKNDSPSLNSRLAIEKVEKEAALLHKPATAWLVYNAMQEVVHEKLMMPFSKQESADRAIFDTLMEMAN